MDLVFHALAHPARRHMMDLVKKAPGCSVNDLCEHFETSRIAVMKNLKVLVEANLIISKKQGRTRELYFNVAPIQMIHDRWSDEYSEFWATQMVDLKYKIESQSKETASSAVKSKSKKSNTASRKPKKKKGNS